MREEFDFSYTDLEAAYQEMAQEEERESLALEWAETTIGDVGDEGVYMTRLNREAVEAEGRI